MAKRNKKTDKLPASTAPASSGPFNAAFGGLAALRAQMGGPEAAPESEPEAERAPAAKAPPGTKPLKRVVLQKERKGHGGKTVTRVRSHGLDPAALEALMKDLKKGLGCGARIEDDEILLQGDIVDRAAAWFEGRGTKKVVRAG